jgi:hypothetical protein
LSNTPKVKFTEQIRPILNKASCRTAACHAAQHGKGGFKLSVFGSRTGERPPRDRSRRDPTAFRSRCARKQPRAAQADDANAARRGRPLGENSVDYRIFLAWLRSGAPGPTKADAEVVKLHVTPSRRVGTVGSEQQLRVEAEFPGGERRMRQPPRGSTPWTTACWRSPAMDSSQRSARAKPRSWFATKAKPRFRCS